MEILEAGIALAISVCALLGTSAQLQAWSLEPSRRMAGIHLLQSQKAMWTWIRQTPSVYWSDNDDHPGRLDYRHHMSERVGWAWLKLASEVSCAASLLGLMTALVSAGPMVLSIGCIAMSAGVVLVGEAYRRNGQVPLGRPMILAGVTAILAFSALIWSLLQSR